MKHLDFLLKFMLVAMLIACANPALKQEIDPETGRPISASAQEFEGRNTGSGATGAPAVSERKEFKRMVPWEESTTNAFYSPQGALVGADVIKEAAEKEEKRNRVISSDRKSKSYTLQFEMVADFDQAQKRRWAVSRTTGLGTYLLFDSPFYKIRGGKWTDRNEAEDTQLQFNAMGIAAIIVEL